MGAPCVDVPYDSIWNVTCICPWFNQSGDVYDTRNGTCLAVRADGACAGVGTSTYTRTYSSAELVTMLTSVATAETKIDIDNCPAEIEWIPNLDIDNLHDADDADDTDD